MGNHTVLRNRTENQMLDTEKNSERKISRNKLLVRGEKKGKNAYKHPSTEQIECTQRLED